MPMLQFEFKLNLTKTKNSIRVNGKQMMIYFQFNSDQLPIINTNDGGRGKRGTEKNCNRIEAGLKHSIASDSTLDSHLNDNMYFGIARNVWCLLFLPSHTLPSTPFSWTVSDQFTYCKFPAVDYINLRISWIKSLNYLNRAHFDLLCCVVGNGAAVVAVSFWFRANTSIQRIVAGQMLVNKHIISGFYSARGWFGSGIQLRWILIPGINGPTFRFPHFSLLHAEERRGAMWRMEGIFRCINTTRGVRFNLIAQIQIQIKKERKKQKQMNEYPTH